MASQATNGYPASPAPASQPAQTSSPFTAQRQQSPQQQQQQHEEPFVIDLQQPPTSTTDSGLSKRPRDTRLIHAVLANLGVASYQERVPLQLMDFAYRYTAGALSDAQSLSSTAGGEGGGRGAASAATAEGGNISVGAIRLAIHSRMQYQFKQPLAKEFMLEMAQEKNRIQLPKVERVWGVRLPPEKYCLTGVGWGLREEWDDDEEVVDDDEERHGPPRQQGADVVADGDQTMGGVTAGTPGADGHAKEEDGEGSDEDEEMGTFEEVMGTVVDDSMEQG